MANTTSGRGGRQGFVQTPQTNPGGGNHRFAGFAALPTPDPKAAADELERTVTQLGFKGAMVHGLTNGVFFDDKRFWPIFERAQALDVPPGAWPESGQSARAAPC